MKKKKPAPPPTHTSMNLVVLTADTNMASAIRGILERRDSLGLRNLRFEIRVHPEKDPGCLKRSVELLRLYAKSSDHALVMFDREGCGQEEDKTREELEETVRSNLAKNGWEDRADVIVIDPELENWVWSTSPHVAQELGWKEPAKGLRAWLLEKGFLKRDDQIKPDRPKEAMEAVLRHTKKPRSSSIYHAVARKVRFDDCRDASFLKLKTLLQNWFGKNS